MVDFDIGIFTGIFTTAAIVADINLEVVALVPSAAALWTSVTSGIPVGALIDLVPGTGVNVFARVDASMWVAMTTA